MKMNKICKESLFDFYLDLIEDCPILCYKKGKMVGDRRLELPTSTMST